MAQRLQELCALLVEDSCGHLSSQVFGALAQNGRLSRPQLHQITRIPNRQLKHILTVLVQHHILLYHTPDEGLPFYQVDWHCYNIVRINRVNCLAQERYGDLAGKIFAFTQQLGRSKIGDLAQAFDFSPVPKRDSAIDTPGLVNGKDGGHNAAGSGTTTVGQFHSTLRKLLKAGFLVKVGKRAHIPAADLQAEMEEIVISEQFPDRKVNGPKKQAEFKSAINTLKRKWREADDYSESRDVESKGAIKRALPPSNPAAKRLKMNGGLGHGVNHGGDDLDDELVQRLPDDMVLKVNYAQCALAFRTERLEEMADQYLGPVTASVYGALLRVLEAKLKARDDEIRDEDDDDEEERLPTATVVEVLEALDPTVDLRLGVLGASDVYKMANGNGKKPKEVILDDEWGDLGIKKEVYSDSEDDQPVNGFMSMRDRNKKMSLIEEHLKLLEEHAKMFCRRVGGGGRGEWRVNFPALTDALIHAEIDSNILDRFGKVHSRIVRLLRDRGRLEEKQVAALSIMRLKDVRAILTELQFVGLVEGQEVPKDNSRQPTRATYLWYQDPSRVASLLLQQTYQGMARILQRLKVERENYKNIIEKAEMLDVKQEALTQNEREAIMQWREVEERLAIQMNRMDDLVALLRDFSGRDSSLVS